MRGLQSKRAFDQNAHTAGYTAEPRNSVNRHERAHVLSSDYLPVASQMPWSSPYGIV